MKAKIHKIIDYESFKEHTQKQIKELGYEETLIRIAWNVTKLMQADNK